MTKNKKQEDKKQSDPKGKERTKLLSGTYGQSKRGRGRPSTAGRPSDEVIWLERAGGFLGMDSSPTPFAKFDYLCALLLHHFSGKVLKERALTPQSRGLLLTFWDEEKHLWRVDLNPEQRIYNVLKQLARDIELPIPDIFTDRKGLQELGNKDKV